MELRLICYLKLLNQTSTRLVMLSVFDFYILSNKTILLKI